MHIVRQLDQKVWQKFVDNHPQGQVFHTPEMFQVFAQTEGHTPTMWAAIDCDHRPLALLLPVQIALKGGLARRFTTRAVVYGSVLCAPGIEGKEALGLLLEVYKKGTGRNILLTELRNLADLSDLQSVLNECSFVHEEHLNFLVDLEQPEEAIWRKIKKSGRKSVHTSRNKGTIVEEVSERQKVATAYQLLQETYARVQVPLASPTLFEAAFDILSPRGMFKVFLARIDEHYIGTCLLLAYGERILYWYAGSDRAFSSYAPGELLIWHALKWGKEQGFQVFDFGGAGKPDEEYGPRRFKAKFGGDLVNYGRSTYTHAPMILQVSKVVYRMARRFLYSG